MNEGDAHIHRGKTFNFLNCDASYVAYRFGLGFR